MKAPRPCLAILSAYLIWYNPRTVSAFPDITLVTRQETCDTLFCGPNWGNWGESIGGWLNNLIQQPVSSPGSFVLPAPENQLTAPQPETVPPTPEILPPVPVPEPQYSDFGQDPSLEPESIKAAPDPGTERCQSVAPSTDSESQTTQQNDPVGYISKGYLRGHRPTIPILILFTHRVTQTSVDATGPSSSSSCQWTVAISNKMK